MEVSDEIVEAFLLDKRAEAARERKMYRYKAFYSLDCDDGIENAAIDWAQPSPEDCLMEKEAQAEHAELIRRLYEAISSLPPTQARRVHARYMLGMKVKDIAAMEKRGIRTDKGEVNRQIAADNKLLKEIKARITRLYNWSKAEAEKPEGQQPSMVDLWEAQQQLKRPDTRTGKIRALQESAALFSFLQANGIQSMQQLHEKIADMNTRYYDLRREIVKAERRIAVLTERGEMWAQYNEYKAIHKQLARVKPEKRELFEQRHSRELILYDAAARYLKELKASGEELSPKEWQREIGLLTAQKQVDSIDMKAMREELKAVERLRKAADQLARQERDKPRGRGPER